MSGPRFVAAALVALTAIVAVTVATAGSGSGSEGGDASAFPVDADAPRPNIVVIQLDDATRGEVSRRTMPVAMRFLAGHGTTFKRFYLNTAQCCPSRSGTLTGQYGHNNGVTANAIGYPGLVSKESTLPAWLEEAGYETIHVGKFLNGYEDLAPAPGWDAWHTLIGERRYFGYSISDNGRRHHHGTEPGDYVTSVLDRIAVREMRDSIDSGKPFYLQVDQRAPHSAAGPGTGPCAGGGASLPAPGDAEDFRDLALPEAPSFNEDVSDKPGFVPRKRISRAGRAELQRKWQCANASLAEVDRGIAAMKDVLRRAGELRNTVVVLLSDNGYFFGEHRIDNGKILPYEEAERVPLLIRLPSSLRGDGPAAVSAPTTNLDLAPTFLELAGATPCAGGACRTLDGRSLMPLITGHEGAWPADRPLLFEYRAAEGAHGVCDFAGVVSGLLKYVRYTAVAKGGTCEPVDERERYDLGADPFELDNLCASDCPDDTEQHDLNATLGRLEDCSGIEGRDPAPPNDHYCG